MCDFDGQEAEMSGADERHGAGHRMKAWVS